MSLSRREFLGKSVSALALGAGSGRLASAAEAKLGTRQPNVIVIICDDLGWGDVGVFHQNARRAAGAAAERTPNLDRLAGAGARLTDHYCGAPVCAPARASLLLGVHQGHANVRDNQFDKALEDNHTLATVLKRAGYATAAFGKWGLQGAAVGGAPHWPAHPDQRGFDTYYGYIRHRDGHQHYPMGDPWARGDARFHYAVDGAGGGKQKAKQRKGKEAAPASERLDPSDPDGINKQVWDGRTEVSAGLTNCYTADLFTARTKRWIVDQVTQRPDQPFFTYLAFDTPHASIELPAAPYPDGGGVKGGLQWLGQAGRMINTADGKPDSCMHPAFAGMAWPDIFKRYATAVRRIDDCVGDLMETLSDLKVAENTLVVFTSDHGPSIESYLPERITPEFFASYGPFDGIKRDCWEGGVRVPAIACWPAKIPGGRVIASPVATCDWMATFAEAAGVAAPARTDGVSLLPLLTGKGRRQDRGFVYIEYFEPGVTPRFVEFEASRRGRRRNQMQMVRMGDYVGVRYDIQSAEDGFELYDVVRDPKQRNNLAADPQLGAMQRQMKELVIRCRRPDASAGRPYDAALMAPVEAATVPGLMRLQFEGTFPWLPDVTRMAPTRAEPVADLRARAGNDGAVQFVGFLAAPSDGEYVLQLSTDAQAFLRVHDAAVIDAGFGVQGPVEKSGSVRLKAGLHPIALSVGGREARVELTWTRPDGVKEAVPWRRSGALAAS